MQCLLGKQFANRRIDWFFHKIPWHSANDSSDKCRAKCFYFGSFDYSQWKHHHKHELHLSPYLRNTNTDSDTHTDTTTHADADADSGRPRDGKRVG